MNEIRTNSAEVAIIATFIRERLPSHGRILLSGDGTAGKSTLAVQIVEALGSDQAGSLEFDQFYWPNDMRREMRVEGETVTGCHPASFDRQRAKDSLELISAGHAPPLYGKSIWGGGDKVSFPVVGRYEPKRWNIVNGFAAVHMDLRWFGLHIFMECANESLEVARRRARNISRQRPDVDEDAMITKTRRAQYERFVLPYREQADLVVISREDYSLELTFQP